MTAKAELLDISANIEAEKIPGQIIYLFPGQGVQKPGMGKILYENHKIAREILDKLKLVKPELLDVIINEPSGDEPTNIFDSTANAQPALVAVSLATYFAFRDAKPFLKEKRPIAFLGHSTGQMSAMGAAGVVDTETALRIAIERGRLMEEVGKRKENKGRMVSLLGVTLEKAQSFCASISEALGEEGIWIANDNTTGEAVLSGREAHIEYALSHLKEAEIKKTVPLPVYIPAHCPLMKEARERLAQYLVNIKFGRPTSPIILNTTAEATWDPDEIKADLINGLTTGVRFRESLREAQRNGATSFVEIGNGPLSGFALREVPDSKRIQFSA